VLDNGGRLWATAVFEDDKTIAGDRHKAHLLMSTSFDSTQATRNEASFIRVVCNNTLRAAHMGNKAVVKTRHSTRFNGAQVARDLADVLQAFDAYKVMGDALACAAMSRDDVVRFFGDVLEIPAGAKRGDKDAASTRKWNQLDDLQRAFGVTQRERNTEQADAWTALQAVTRYVDHDRSTRGSDGTADGLAAARFDSGTFGSGDALKGKALNLLLPLIDFTDREKVLVRA
jgi:phage/plasmid-like protein (TIGR03299 family)